MTDIYHSGIKGQRKGVRRFQYANGTYTPAGNERYRPSNSKSSRAVNRMIIGGAMGEIALVAAKRAQSQTAAMSLPAIIAAASAKMASLNASRIAAGKAVTAAILAIPTPVKAMALPLLAIGAGVAVATVAMNSEEIVAKIRELPWDKIKSATVSVGAAAAGVAMSTVSGNPLPAVTGLTFSSLATLLERDY